MGATHVPIAVRVVTTIDARVNPPRGPALRMPSECGVSPIHQRYGDSISALAHERIEGIAAAVAQISGSASPQTTYRRGSTLP